MSRLNRLVCLGDSITRAAEFAEAERWPQRLGSLLAAATGTPVTVYNRGVGGHTSAQGHDRFGEDVLPLLPACVLIQFGFNDANVRDWATEPRVSVVEYRRNLAAVHALVVRHGGWPVFIIDHPPGRVPGRQGNGRSYAENHAPYADAARALADALGAPAVDLPAALAARGLRPGALVGADGLHLSPAGNRLYAELLAEALLSMAAVAPAAAGREAFAPLERVQ